MEFYFVLYVDIVYPRSTIGSVVLTEPIVLYTTYVLYTTGYNQYKLYVDVA
jgi:hypothetical protein